MPSLSMRNQVLLGTLLLLLLITTRGHSSFSFDFIPSSTIGVFFLLGVYFRQVWVLTFAFAMVWTMDMAGLTWSGSSNEFCLSNSYLFLLLSYATYWLGGRLFARLYAGESLTSLLRLAVIAPVAGAVGYLIAASSFHYLSGQFDADFSVMFSDYLARLPAHLEGLAVYLLVAVIAQIAISTLANRASHLTAVS